MRDDRERLLDMAEAIAAIEKYAARGRDAFERDELIRNWVQSHLQVMGEAARGLSDEFRRAHPDVPWSDIIGMRNVLVHRYFGVDPEVVWSVVQNRLPELRRRVASVLEEMPGAEDD